MSAYFFCCARKEIKTVFTTNKKIKYNTGMIERVKGVSGSSFIIIKMEYDRTQ
jgi:hypothetical protein